MESKEGVSPRRLREQYDPCSPENVRSASNLEVAESELELLNQQLAGVRSLLARREKTDPDSQLVQDYRKRIREMEQEIAEAEARKAALSDSETHEDQRLKHERVESGDTTATRSLSLTSTPESEEKTEYM